MSVTEAKHLLPETAATREYRVVNPATLELADFDILANRNIYANDEYSSYAFFLMGDGGEKTMGPEFHFKPQNLGGAVDLLMNKHLRDAKSRSEREHYVFFIARMSWMDGPQEPFEKFYEIPAKGRNGHRHTEIFWYVRMYALAALDSNGMIQKGDVNGYDYFSFDLAEIEQKRADLHEKYKDSNFQPETVITSVEIFINFEDQVRHEHATYTIRHKARDFVIAEQEPNAVFMYPVGFREHINSRPVLVAPRFKHE